MLPDLCFQMSRWGDSKTLNFIIRYREYECLWNMDSLLYKNKIARENAYKQLLLEFMDDENVTMKMIKSKIKNLRSVYHRELKKIKDSVCSGDDAAQIYKPSIPWFEEMHFILGDNMEYRKTISTKVETSQPDVHDNSNTTLQSEAVSETSQISTASEQSSGLAPQRLLRRGKRRHDDTLLSDALERLENIISTQINTPRNNEDEFYYFALSIAAQLRKLPLQTALHLQTKIQNQLFMARTSEINRKISPISTSTLSIPNEETSTST